MKFEPCKIKLFSAAQTWPQIVVQKRNCYQRLLKNFNLPSIDESIHGPCEVEIFETWIESIVNTIKESKAGADINLIKIADKKLKLVRQVKVDLLRIRPEFPSNYLSVLARILIVFGMLMDNAVEGVPKIPLQGYTQGMHDIAAILFMVFNNDAASNDQININHDHTTNAKTLRELVLSIQATKIIDVEADTFFCLHALLARLHPLFSFKTGLKKALAQVDDCLKVVDPKLSAYLSNLAQPLSPQTYCLPWLLTMFSQNVSFEDVLPLWDALLASGGVVQVRLTNHAEITLQILIILIE